MERRLSPARLITASCLILFPAAFALITGYMLYQERAAVGRAAEQQADNIATMLQNDLEHTVGTIDAALNDVRIGLPLVEKQPFTVPVQRLILFDSAMRQSEFGSVLVLNDRGVTTFDSRSAVPRQGDAFERDWFKRHRDSPDDGLHVELDGRGWSERPVLTFSRGLKRSDGSFGGVVVATMQLSLLRDMFGSLHLGNHDDVVLRTVDGRGIYRRSTGSDVFGMDVSGAALFGAAGGPGASVAVDPAKGHLLVDRQLKSLPLTVTVGLFSDDIYAAWWSGAWMVGGSVTLLLVLASLLAFRLRRELRARERAEAEVRENEAKFRLLADNASDMISRVDASGERVYISPAAERLLGVPPERLLGQALWAYIDPRDTDVLIGLRDALETAETPLSACFRVRRDSGELRWVEALARPILNPVTRAPGGYISAWRDITDRKRAELRLGENEARYRALAENASDIITSFDIDLNRTYVSPAAKVILGFEPDELLRAPQQQIVHPEDRAEATAHLESLRSGKSDREELVCRLRHRSGHYVWIEGKLSLIRDPATGTPASILCSIRDISERRAQQETLLAANLGLERLSRHLVKARDTAQQANDAKSRFLANVSHELRTPLNGILGYTQLLQIEGGLSPKQATRVEAMVGAGQHLLEMINSVLDISEIEAGHLELRPVSIDLVGVSAACLDLVRPAAESKKLSLNMELIGDLPPRVVLDPTRFRQILLNLLGNAVKYTASGEVRLRIRQLRQSRLRFEISDTGPGIAMDRRDRLFQDFERLGVDTVSEVEGAGIGLALSRRLTATMGGEMGHEDNPGGGSVFWFELSPDIDTATRPAAGSDAACSEPASAPTSLRVLVVDDVAINRDVTASFLRVAGHRPTCANSGEDAVALAGAARFDLILIDVRMPGIGGLEATRQIRSLPAPAGTVPIAALTAQAFAEEIAACHAAGMNAHLTKPFTQAALQGVLDQACDLNRQRAALPVLAPHPGPEPAPDGLPDRVPLIDRDAFRQTVETLPADKVASHLHALTSRTQALLETLRPEGSLPRANWPIDGTASAAHLISGSAGVFGFAHLAMVARNFEYAARYQPTELAQMTASLIDAADASLSEMKRCAFRLQTSAPVETSLLAMT